MVQKKRKKHQSYRTVVRIDIEHGNNEKKIMGLGIASEPHSFFFNLGVMLL
jgi:hypothetical protein